MSKLKGATWVFNNTITTAYCGASCIDTDVLFTCSVRHDGKNEYYGIGCNSSQLLMEMLNSVEGDEHRSSAYIVYNQGTWDNEGYKTITFVSEPTSFTPDETTFLTWLEANATKQQELLDIDGAKILYTDLRQRVDTKAPIDNPEFTGSISLGRSGNVGENSIAVGNSVKAEGKNSVAFGQDTRAIGRNQFVFGSGNVADITPDWNSSTQYYIGDRVRVSHNDSCWKALQDNINVMPGTNSLMWMRTSDNNYVEIVGIGSVTSPVTGRKLDWNGNEYLAGKLYISAGGYGATDGKEVAVKDDPVFTGSLTLGNTTLTESALQNLLSLTSANGVSF